MITATLDAVSLRNFATLSVAAAAKMLVPEQVGDAARSGPRATPRPLRQWLAGLRLLEAVPFSHLVPHPALLPAESIRFFESTAPGPTRSSRARCDRHDHDRRRRRARVPVPDGPRRGRRGGAPRPISPAGARCAGAVGTAGTPAASCSGRHSCPDGRRCTCAPTAETRPRMAARQGRARRHADQRLITLRMELAPAVLLALFDGVP